MESIAPPLQFRPSVCHQTDDSHIHYNLTPLKMLTNDTNVEVLRRLARRVGGRTAGQVITALQARLQIGESFAKYGLLIMEMETLPTYQICHKGEVDSPAVDWDAVLF